VITGRRNRTAHDKRVATIVAQAERETPTLAPCEPGSHSVTHCRCSESANFAAVNALLNPDPTTGGQPA
jgi:hypothetical protein